MMATKDKSTSGMGEQTLNPMFADRITDVPRSFIREILKVAIHPETISFAGGLPNRETFPVSPLQHAAGAVFETAGRDALQYSNSEGYLPLRNWIADRYREKKGLAISPDNILITNGSQQGLDLLGKTFLNDHDGVVIEEPGYLGAIQAFSIYRAEFLPVPLGEDGLDTNSLAEVLSRKSPKLMYTVPNFQNPSGVTYPASNRETVAACLKGHRTLLIEDDPYGDLRFEGEPQPSFKNFLPDQTVMLGSFSKIVAPGFRLGWLAASDPVMERILVAKQASDLHSDSFIQRVMHHYLTHNDLDAHIRRINSVYCLQCLAMIDAIREYLPGEVRHTSPSGGMFVWLTLPAGLSSMALFHLAIADHVAFVPGNPFYVDGRDRNTLRLNFTCTDVPTIREGVRRLAAAFKKLLA